MLRHKSTHIPCLSSQLFFLFVAILSLHSISSPIRAFSATVTRKQPINLASNRILCSGRSDMLLRIRNNVGTWKLQLDTDNEDAGSQVWKVKDILSEDVFEQYKLVQPLSFDPSGTKPLSKTKTLLDQGLIHGSMIYCRVKERDLLADDDTDSSVEVYSPPPKTQRTRPVQSSATNPTVSFKAPKLRSQPVKPSFPPKEAMIEILSSEDDDDMDKIKRKPSPKTRVPRKRAPSVEGASGSASAKKARSNQTTQSVASQMQSPSSTSDFKIASYNIW